MSSRATVTAPAPPALLKADLGWLCAQVLTAYRRAAAPVMADLPAGHRGYLVLAAAASDCANNQLEVAHRLGIDRSVLVGILDDLEAAGLVARKPNPADRRERTIAVTPAGTTRLAAIQKQLDSATKHTLAPLSASERKRLVDMLHAVVASFGDNESLLIDEQCER